MAEEPRRPRPPTRLGESGRALWRDVVKTYVLTPPELRLLAEVCATLDAAETLEALAAEEGPMTEGSKGQDVLHPAVSEARQQRLAFARLLGQLALPDPEGSVVRTPAQLRAQRAGQARWRAMQRRESA